MKNLENEIEATKMYCGIDTLYYFCESNDYYEDLFLEILDQYETTKGKFEREEIQFLPNDIKITLNDMSFEFLGQKEGYYWFRDLNEYFKIGFKDYKKNQGLHNIRVQLQGEGIYTLGLSSLLELINNKLLGEYITGHKPATRIDLNCFVQHGFSFVNKEMFVSRKRVYSQISEIGSSKRTQTIYVGKVPFKLRLYDKRAEMKQSKKGELMKEFFLNNNFDLDDELFNVEFEMHRRYLKDHEIDTIEDALENAESLFKKAMDEIRLIDLNSITEKHIKNNSKNKADTLPIWDEIKDAYSIEEFMQNKHPVERIKRKLVLYSDEKFKEEFQTMIRKALIHRLPIRTKLLEKYLDEAIEALTTPKKVEKFKGLDIEIEDKKGKKEHFRLIDDGLLIRPFTRTSVVRMRDDELLGYLDDFSKEPWYDQNNTNKYLIAYKEAAKRGLVKNIPF